MVISTARPRPGRFVHLPLRRSAFLVREPHNPRDDEHDNDGDVRDEEHDCDSDLDALMMWERSDDFRDG